MKLKKRRQFKADRGGNMLNLILGGGGFIGSNLANRLKEMDQAVLIADDFSLGQRAFLSNFRSDEIIDGSILDEKTWGEIYSRAGVENVLVWHLAANSDIQKGAISTVPDMTRTLRTSTELIEKIHNVRVTGIVFSSTSAVYGSENYAPSENSPTNPISNYGVAKLASENFLKIYCSKNSIPLWIFRFANIIGAPATHGVIFDFCNKLQDNNLELQVLGNGTQRKAYLHIHDLITMVMELQSKKNEGGTWNLGPDDDGISVAEIATQVVKHVSPNAGIQFGDSPQGWPGDISKIVLDTDRLQADVNYDFMSSHEAVHKAIHEITSDMNISIQCNRPL
jgi:UDP-glucose 4-epimerase